MGKYVRLAACPCGGRPKIERLAGWWHIECKSCGFHSKEPDGVTFVWGYNTRREASEAWNKAAATGGPFKEARL